jgi:hypothetical protein
MATAVQVYVEAADLLDKATREFDVALSAGDNFKIEITGLARDAARRALDKAAKAAGC